MSDPRQEVVSIIEELVMGNSITPDILNRLEALADELENGVICKREPVAWSIDYSARGGTRCHLILPHQYDAETELSPWAMFTPLYAITKENSDADLKPCPFCGHTPYDLMDAIHPTGAKWREDDGIRHYIRYSDPREGQLCYVVNCFAWCMRAVVVQA